MNEDIFKKKTRDTRLQESFVLNGDGDIAVRTVLGSDPLAAPGEVDISEIGGDAVPVLGTVPALPTIIVDDDGNQITSFGSPSYRGEYNSPVDFTASYLSSNAITLAALMGFVIEDDSQIAGVKVIHADKTSEIFANGSGGMTLTHSSGIITLTGATPFLSGDVYEVGINAQEKGWDGSTGSHLQSNITPEWGHYTAIEHSDIDNVLADTYQEVMFMDGYRSAAIQVLGSGGVTFKIYMTLAEEAPDDDFSGDLWEDATLDVLGAASIVDSGAIGFIETIRMPKKIGIEYVTSAATNAIDIYKRKY